MKRIWNVIALGAIIVIGLGTFAVNATETTAEWVLKVGSNPTVWKDRTVDVSYSMQDAVNKQFEVTLEESRPTTNLSYFEEGLRYRERLSGDERKIHRQMNRLTFAQSIQTGRGFLGIGQRGNDELVVFKQLDGESISTYTFEGKDSQISDVITGFWAGLFVQKNELNLIYREGHDGEERTMLATFNEAMNDVTVSEIKMDKGFVSHVFGTNRFYNTNMLMEKQDTRFVPVGVGGYESVIEYGQTSYNQTDLSGLYAYDTKERQVVKLLSDKEFWTSTIVDNELIALTAEGDEVVIDLNTLKQTTRKTLEGSVKEAYYLDNLLYQVRSIKDGVIIDVYEDGEQISSATVLAENDEAKAMLNHATFYVR
ncbi:MULTISPECIES: hypothetical protein [Exiguobacterium]|uniref:hypothetical protein n=1 Tax=Exiguobacterium TaxID=33986 RepID=UPI001BEBF123|nr:MULTISPECIES: hypothetical protein [Exiguobacterium]MCT4782968.1 hypothetical protein [Exiguobacterium himgiriensis]